MGKDPKIKSGDLVEHRLGGPKMIAVESSYRSVVNGQEVVECEYLTRKGKWKTRTFVVSSLNISEQADLVEGK